MSSFYKTFVALEGPYTICAPGFLQGAKLGKLTADYEPKGGRENPTELAAVLETLRIP